MHAAQAFVERAVLIHFQIATGAHESWQNVRRLEGEPLCAHMSRCKVVLQMPVKLKSVSRFDLTEQP
jgi:hypothetical protein